MAVQHPNSQAPSLGDARTHGAASHATACRPRRATPQRRVRGRDGSAVVAPYGVDDRHHHRAAQQLCGGAQRRTGGVGMPAGRRRRHGLAPACQAASRPGSARRPHASMVSVGGARRWASARTAGHVSARTAGHVVRRSVSCVFFATRVAVHGQRASDGGTERRCPACRAVPPWPSPQCHWAGVIASWAWHRHASSG